MRNCCEKGEGLWDQDLMIRYRKIPKISPGAYIFQRPFLRGLSTEGNFRFNLRLYLRAIFQINAPEGGAYIWRGDLTEGFLR